MPCETGRFPVLFMKKGDASETPPLALAPVLRTMQFQGRAGNLQTDTSDTVLVGNAAN